MANGGVKGPCLSPVQRSSLQRWLGAVGRGCAALFLVAAVLIVSAVQQAWAQTSPLVDPEKGRIVTGKLPDTGGTQHGFSQVFGPGFHPSKLGWSVAHYDFSHPKFDTDWRRDQISASAFGLQLTLSPKEGGANRFDGASMRRPEPSHYGRYEITLQPARGAGVVTGFFTYSGPYYGTRHDEIDIEFLGKDTTKLHLAWFVDGAMRNRFIDLGFDAADRPRRYAFEWWPDRLRWFVEGKLIFETTAQDGPLPKVPGYLFANIWAADPVLEGWAGLADPGVARTALLSEIRYRPFSDAQIHVHAAQTAPSARQGEAGKNGSRGSAGPALIAPHADAPGAGFPPVDDLAAPAHAKPRP